MPGWTSFNGKEPVKMSHEHKEGYKDPMVKSLVPSPITWCEKLTKKKKKALHIIFGQMCRLAHAVDRK